MKPTESAAPEDFSYFYFLLSGKRNPPKKSIREMEKKGDEFRGGSIPEEKERFKEEREREREQKRQETKLCEVMKLEMSRETRLSGGSVKSKWQKKSKANEKEEDEGE
ncbi:hypothetical protein RUM44_005374 [Polyplax serrata]|uniref:Uncharacterized protein n=1 Tax=Polyplax serrata TaxID=468196 RepID=A0ABR1ADD0_POLSC